jgi:hypothetical protein
MQTLTNHEAYLLQRDAEFIAEGRRIEAIGAEAIREATEWVAMIDRTDASMRLGNGIRATER